MRSWSSSASLMALVCCWACGDDPSAAGGPREEPARNGSPAAPAQRGPVCSTCLLGGGESSDFDGGSDSICPDLIRPESVSEADVQSAGWDTVAFRRLVERSFESELGWTDLTSTTAFPRSPGISGFESQTRIRATVELNGEWQRLALDPARCTGGVCTLAERVEDCSASISSDRYFSPVGVTLQTDDGAIGASLSGRAWLAPPRSPADASWQSHASFVASADIAGVDGMLRVEPLPAAPYGQLRIAVSYFESAVRGRLSVDFTNQAQEGTGQPLIDETPLEARFPPDGCDTVPTPLTSPHPLLMQRTPGELLDALRTAVDAADEAGRWLQTGRDVRIDVEVGTPEYACVGAWPSDEGLAGQIMNVPVRLHTSDGLLDWTEAAIYRFDASLGATAHRLVFDRLYVPTAPILNEALGAFAFPPRATWRAVHLRASYPASAELAQPSELVLQVTSPADCAGNDLPCAEAYRAAYVEQCLVAPAGVDCVASPPVVTGSLPAPF